MIKCVGINACKQYLSMGFVVPRPYWWSFIGDASCAHRVFSFLTAGSEREPRPHRACPTKSDNGAELTEGVKTPGSLSFETRNKYMHAGKCNHSPLMSQ